MSDDQAQKPELKKTTYFISTKGPILVASFIGTLDRENIQVLDQCRQELLTHHKIRQVILHFRELSEDMCGSAFPVLASLQKAIRDIPARLRISGLRPELRKRLLNEGLVRPEELSNNVAEALQSLAQS